MFELEWNLCLPDRDRMNFKNNLQFSEGGEAPLIRCLLCPHWLPCSVRRQISAGLPGEHYPSLQRGQGRNRESEEVGFQTGVRAEAQGFLLAVG